MAIRLSDDVEELFVKHFAKDDKRKAMKYLKPNHRKESHSVTFFIGVFTGCLIALLSGYVIMAHLMGMYTQQSADTVYMETVYPVLSVFSLLFLHILLYGCNIFTWKKTRINYSFILELSPTKELKYREVFLICTSSMTAIIGVLFIHLSLSSKGYSSILVHTIPGFLLLCARRWFHEGQVTHSVNLGKYVSAMVAAGAKLAYEKEKTGGYLSLVVALSTGATMYQLYWDYVMDWGLLQFQSKNPWLRNDLMLNNKFIYYFSMVLNLILRLA